MTGALRRGNSAALAQTELRGATPAPAAPTSAVPTLAVSAPAVPALAVPALALEAISLSFGGIHALRDVSFDILPGEIRAVIGPNGAGKSSLVNVISGLYTADSGRVWIDGQAFARVPAHRLSTLGIARTFQNLALFPGLSVAQNIAAGLVFRRRHGLIAQISGLPAARRESQAVGAKLREIAGFLGLSGVLDQSLATLPYGLQKQVELARALIAEPRLLLLDEPMAGLTATEKRDMAGHIRAVRERLGLAVILIEHDIGVVMELSDRVAVLDHGVLIADGTPAQVQRDPEVIRAYLGDEDDERETARPEAQIAQRQANPQGERI